MNSEIALWNSEVHPAAASIDAPKASQVLKGKLYLPEGTVVGLQYRLKVQVFQNNPRLELCDLVVGAFVDPDALLSQIENSHLTLATNILCLSSTLSPEEPMDWFRAR